MRLRKGPDPIPPARPVNAPVAKWRVSACFKIQNPASFALTGLLKSKKILDFRDHAASRN
jgi:hypothetical protein